MTSDSGYQKSTNACHTWIFQRFPKAHSQYESEVKATTISDSLIPNAKSNNNTNSEESEPSDSPHNDITYMTEPWRKRTLPEKKREFQKRWSKSQVSLCFCSFLWIRPLRPSALVRGRIICRRRNFRRSPA